MKTFNRTKPILILMAVFAAGNLEARPGRGGGGGPGGGFRPSRPSAPVNRPAARPAPGPRPGTMPSRPGNPGGINRPVGGGPGSIRPAPPRPGVPPARPGGRPNAGDIGRTIGNHPPGALPGTPGHRPGYPYYHKTEMRPNIHRHFTYNPVYGYPFSRGWYGQARWHYQFWPYWAAAATGAAIATWVGMPAYGGYGSSQAITYYPVESAPQDVYDQNVVPVQQVTEQGQSTDVADDAQWLNLGAFGLIPINQKDITYAIQLAMTNTGAVRGFQWDLVNNKSVEVAGSIEKDTMRIAWQAKDSPNAPYFETNVDQLTQEESLINVYDPPTKSLVSWQVIQIDDKDLPPKP